MKRAIDLGAVEAAAIRTPSGKIRLRLLLSAEQLEQMLIAARNGDDDTSCDADADSVTHCDARLEERRSEHDDEDDARARPPPSAPSPAESAERVFVIEGTRAWQAWCAHKLRTTGRDWTLTVNRIVDGKSRTGWWFPSLFPPSAGADPPQASDDDDEFAKSA